MLRRANRMNKSSDFRSTIRDGRRSGDAVLVVHYRADEESASRLVGFIVAKKEIKLATKRNLVKRRLRSLMEKKVGEYPPGTRIVVRALSGAYMMPSSALEVHLDYALHKAYSSWNRSHKRNPYRTGE